MSLPPELAAAIAEHLGATPRAVVIHSSAPTGQLARFTVGGKQYCVKWTAPPPNAALPDACAMEAHGLRLLAEAGAVRVPQVIIQEPARGAVPPFIVLEWIDRQPDGEQAAARTFGTQLAALHRHTAPAYGLDIDNYCGATPQVNTWQASWVEFYRRCRLEPQIVQAASSGLLPTSRRRGLERIVDRLDTWLDARPEPPSLTHGDLWAGNWLVDQSGRPVLIDPAVSYSHREAELAMCHLFRGFPQDFFDAYDAAWPPLAGRDDRMPLYQLYHLLNHLNVFGESYGGRVDAVVQRYVG